MRLSRGGIGLAIVAGLLGAGLPSTVLAHGAGANGGELGQVLSSWSVDPVALLLIVALGGGYAWLWRRMRAGPRLRMSRWRAASFGAGVFVVAMALLSPIDAYADDLFWSHMVQHVALMSVAAPLLLLGRPVTVVLRGSSRRVRRQYLIPLLRSRALAFLTTPGVALAIFIVTVWAWHAPPLYNAAIRSDAAHAAEHLTFFAGALLFWWLIIDADRSALRRGHVVRAVLLFAAIVQGLLLGVVLLLVEEPIYSAYEEAAALREWGPSALSDQKTAAGLVWIPSGIVFALALLITVQSWFEAMEERARRDDALRLRALELKREAESHR